MFIEYGNIKTNINWKYPSYDIFNNWKVDFFSLEESNFFDVYLVGGFLEKINNKREHTRDIDIILTNNHDIPKIEKLLNEGTRLGIEKYNVFFDILWINDLPIYSEMKFGEIKKVKVYLPANKWIVDGVVKKEYTEAKRISQNLWEIDSYFPSKKQREILESGYVYSLPLKLNN